LRCPQGGAPNFQRWSSRNNSPDQSEILNGGLADVIKVFIGEGVFDQRPFGIPPDVGNDAPNGKVHSRMVKGGVVAFLPVDGDVGFLALMRVDEFLGLREKAARAAAGIIDAAFGRFDHFDHGVDDGFRRVKFAAALALGPRKFRDKVFVNAPDKIKVGLVARQLEVGKQIDQAGEHGAVEGFLAKDLEQSALEAFSIGLNRAHGVVDHDADAQVFRVFRKRGPARLLRHPEGVFSEVFVAIFRIGELLSVELVVHAAKSN